MKFSRTVAYAFQATLQLARAYPGEPISCSRLAASGKMPERFLLQILRNLVAHGILTSTRGVDGGYSLGRDPRQITLLELVEAIDGPITAVLPFAEAFEPESRCKLIAAVGNVTASARRELEKIKLADLLPTARARS